ncbi:hypothetical protein HPB51_017219 [Rhipicephalus microplus]|uniref:Uncharacterized protein n=1 Tax=Rhipicephalus microplus TaxID=6941 RepID=A0A9J6EAY0_RHIMP|nr:hypothetical protein HPB51_017219 [Rhipicephalus microplus]
MSETTHPPPSDALDWSESANSGANSDAAPQSAPAVVEDGSEDDSAPMETVALETTDIYSEDSDAGKETDLKRYFSNTPTDVAACSFFDSLAVSTSPMMKSVSEVNMAQKAALEDVVPEAPITTEKPPEESSVYFSLGDSTAQEPEIAVIAQEAVEGPTPSYSMPAQEPVVVESAENRNDSRSAGEEGPSLSKFFSSDCSGGDQEGKAFFDVLAAGIAGVEQSGRSSGSASPISFVQEPCLMAEPVEDGDICAYDSWLPSAATRDFLARLATSEPGTVIPEREQLTMPGVIIDECQGDTVRVLLQEHIIDEAGTRRTLTADDVPQNEDGLKQLIGAQCHNAAINLTTRLLTNVGQGPGAGGHPSRHSPHSLQACLALSLWYTRLALFVKLRKFAYAEVEGDAFGDLDKPDLFYEFYPDTYPGKRASMKLWEDRECRVYFAILNCVLNQKDYVVAIKVARILLEKNSGRKAQLHSAIGRIYLQAGSSPLPGLFRLFLPSCPNMTLPSSTVCRRWLSKVDVNLSLLQLDVDCGAVLKSPAQILRACPAGVGDSLWISKGNKPSTLSSLVITALLQLGDVETAQSHFHKAEALYHSMALEGRLEILINKGTMALAMNSYAEAYRYYEEASKLQPKNPLVRSRRECLRLRVCWLGCDVACRALMRSAHIAVLRGHVASRDFRAPETAPKP